MNAADGLALGTDGARSIGIGVIAVIIVLAVIFMVVINWIVSRAIVAIVAIVLAIIVYVQRDKIESAARTCDATFFGVHLTPSNPTIKQRCQQIAQ